MPGASGASAAAGASGSSGLAGSGSGGASAGGDAGAAGRPDPIPFHPDCATLPPTRAIGNWDVVPGQTFETTFEVGVVAFHEEGVDVVFSVDGAELARVADPTFNWRTNVYEYWTTLQADDHGDGPIVVSAVIEPDCPDHQPRTLDDLTLYANSGGSLTNAQVRWVDCAAGSDDTGDGSEQNPFATIERGYVDVGAGGTVLLQAGDCYELTALYDAADYDRWTTIRPAPGVSRDEVQILAASSTSGTSTGRFGENMVRFQDVGIFKDEDPGYSTIFYFESDHSVWFDGAELYDARGQWNGGNPWGGNSPYSVYLTDVYLHDLENAGYGFGRGVTMENIGSDIFRAGSNLLSVNLTVLGIDRGTTEAHPDFFQLYSPDGVLENIVIYNTLVYDMGAQGIFGGEGSLTDVAFVNLLMEKDPADSALTSQLTGDWNHVLLWHLTTVDSGFMLREPADLNDFYIQNGSFASLNHGGDTSLPGFTIDHNHFSSLIWDQTDPMGTNATVGDPGYADVSADDYAPAPDSPLCGTGVPLPGLPADVAGNLYDPLAPALGAFACP